MYLLIKPASGACDLRCRYCFYHDELSQREVAIRGIMSHDTVATILTKALARCAEKHPAEPLSVGFQGGEPLLAGVDFFRFVCEHVDRQNTSGVKVAYFLQTNGTHITEEFADLFAERNFLIGLSVDGPKEYHDMCRVTASGGSCFSSVMRGAELLRRRGVDFNILTVVTAQTARHAQRIYGFFAKCGFKWQQYIPCVAPLDGHGSEKFELAPREYGNFLCRMFDLWYADAMKGREHYVYNRDFENWIGILAGYPPEECGMCGVCSEQYLIESDGAVYPCDFYALDDYCLGNLVNDSFDDIDAVRESLRFIAASRRLPDECRECRWLSLCRNGCRRNRVGGEASPICSLDHPSGRNRFCAAYSEFFEYAYPKMRRMADMLARGRRG